ncbi:dipeptide/oligopeptide/nickel ABC transporter permease/ATP-binding protein [Dactylosporangium darangshiense]|uniref:Dipeptide/oligopeptide/nickel ABC transporter permease/ATP-binding protein n=1 Tax=Dactylosporangium darangshiense TaxID=579108 RepID=A0ABP8DCZ8_9ACTN
MRSLLRKANPITVTAAVALLLLVVLAVVGPWFWSDAAERTDAVNASAGFSGEHWFGTDQLGRDLFARTLVATRLSLLLAVTAAVIGMVIGIPLGILPSVLGGRVRRLVAGFITASVALPGLLLALFVNTIIGVGATGAVIGIGIANAPTLARLAQTTSAGVASRDYVAAARMLGASRFTLLFRHILPNVAEPLILTGTMSVGWCLLEISALSFLGLGVRAPSYDWGDLLNQGLQGIYVNPMGALGPGLFVVLGGLAFALLGESVTSLARRVPRLRGAPAAAPAAAGTPTDDVLAVSGLHVQYPSRDGAPLDAVDDVSFTLRPGERVGIVGESGSGKSTTVLGLAELIAYPGRVTWRELRINGADLATASPQQRRRLLGASLALVSQNPMTALNPALRVGRQLAEVAQVHLGKSRSAANELAVRQLEHVQITDPARRVRQFPHEFSGGMRQRAVIAMGLMGEPRLILADEPTTALDVTVQRQVLDLLERLNAETGAALLLVSHDIAVVTNRCERVLVMYGGRVVEDASADELLAGPAHPYARALMAAVPTMTSERDRALATIPGRPPSLAEMPPGCSFAPRCPLADDRCRTEQPPLVELSATRRVECWHPQPQHTGSVREHA